MISAAKITIGVEKTKDGNHTTGIVFVGDEGQLIPLLGALTHAQRLVSDRISKRIGQGTWGNVDGVQQPTPTQEAQKIEVTKEEQYPMEQKMSRDEAIAAIQYSIDAMKIRIKKMKKSPPNATFSIDNDLLSKI